MATSRSESGSLRPSLNKDREWPRAGSMKSPFRRVLVANRGEIAVRIIRACHELGMEAVAIYSDADATARHVWLADQAVRIGPPAASESYLRIDAILDAARATGSEAIHPGYGFLAERSAFARAVEEAGLVFVGPSSDSIDALGDKLHARRTAREAGSRLFLGRWVLRESIAPPRSPRSSPRPMRSDSHCWSRPPRAAAAGACVGWQRQRICLRHWRQGLARAADAFGDGSVYLEREDRPARHIEVQLLGDATGQASLRSVSATCSIQRRHQKLVEETPAPGPHGRSAP